MPKRSPFQFPSGNGSSPPPASGEHLLTIREAAAYARISIRTVRNLVLEGRLRAVQIGRLTRFRLADVRDCFRPD